MSLECKIYQRELRVLGYGLPLYEPNPAEYDRVRVGDVGIAQKNGYFRRIFNALPQLDPNVDDINTTYGIPEAFELLPEACRSTTTSNEISAGSWLRSDHVKQIEGDFDFSMSAVSAGARVNFIVNNRQAAALRIKHSAERVDASRLALYRAYMLKHYKSWARFIRDLGFEFDLRDMILVTGHDLTANWATATLIERASQGGITMQAGDSAILGASTSISGTTESSIRVPIRVGPNPYNPPRRSTHLSVEVSEAGPTKDQCIFLRGFRVSEKLFVPRIMKAAAEPGDIDSDRDSDAYSGVVSVGFDSDEDVQEEEEFVDHNFVMNAILQTDAEIAIVHETDICNLAKMTGNSTHGLNSASDFTDNGMVLDIEFDEYLQRKVGTIRRVPTEPQRGIDASRTSIIHRPPEVAKRVYWAADVEHEPNDIGSTPSCSSVMTDETLVSTTPFSADLSRLDAEAPTKSVYLEDAPSKYLPFAFARGDQYPGIYPFNELLGDELSRHSSLMSHGTSSSSMTGTTLVSRSRSPFMPPAPPEPERFENAPSRTVDKLRCEGFAPHLHKPKKTRMSWDNNPDNLREVIRVLHTCIVELREENQRLRDELQTSRSPK